MDELAVEVVRELAEVGVGEFAGFNLAAATTSSFEALQAYLEGETYYRRGEFEASVRAFQHAFDEDPTFALAQYRLGLSRGWLAQNQREAQEDLQAALAGGLPERESLFARAALAIMDDSPETLPELRAYVRSHPDDADAWFILGDALLHDGVVEVDDWLAEGRRALDRAVELDPGFAPHLIHTLQLALVSGDSTHAAGIAESYGVIRPGTQSDRVNRIVLREEYGASDSTTIAAADTLSGLGDYPDLLLMSSRSVELAEAHYLRQAEVSGEIDLRLCLHIPLRDGSLRKLIEYATDPRMNRDVFVCLYMARILGLPISEELLDQAAERLPREERERPGLFGATWAAERGEWDEYESVLAGLRQRLAAADVAGDPAQEPDWEHELRSAEAFGLMARGQAEEAAAALESLKSGWWIDKWWLGQLYLELVQPRDAIRWLNTFVSVSSTYWPVAYLYLGQAYEQLGDLEKAAEYYTQFVELWKDADPELQPRVQSARQRLDEILAEEG